MEILKRKMILLVTLIFIFQSLTCNTVFAVDNTSGNSSDNLVCENIYSGFKLKAKTYMKCIDSTICQFEHKKTGAKVCFVKNNDKNKTFALGLKILPTDSTGVFHVLEHIIANKVKKISNIDANAHTNSCFMSYHGTTKDDDTLEEYIKKLLESAYFSNIDEKEFRQEGWRYEINDANQQLQINGIVYSEEKKRNSSISGLLPPIIEDSLFTNGFHFDEGGTVEEIPNLTYEKLVESYKEYFKPSNSLMYCYGDMDIEKTLQIINDDYLCKLSKSKSITIPKKIEKDNANMPYVEAFYSIPSGSDANNKTNFSLNYSLGNDADLEIEKSIEILQTILEPYLQDAFLNNNLGELRTLSINPFTIIAIDSDETNKDRIKTIVDDTLKNIVENGLDKEKVEYVFNTLKIKCSENSSSNKRGNKLINKVFETWAVDSNVEKGILLSYDISEIEEKYKKNNRYFEEMIDKYLLNNKHSSLVEMRPKAGLDEEKKSKLEESIKKYQESLSAEQINEIKRQNEELKSWQESNSTKESDTSINLDQINKEVEEIPSVVNEMNGTKVIKHNMYTNNIEYINMYFDVNRVPQDKLMYLILLSKVIGNVNTKSYTYEELRKNEDKYLGDLNFEMHFPNCVPLKNNIAKLNVSMSTLSDNVENSFNILNEIVQNSDFSDKDNIKAQIKKIKSEMKEEMDTNPYQYIDAQSLSYNSDDDKFYSMQFIPFYNFICKLEGDFDKYSDEVIENLNCVKDLVFCKNNLIVSYTGCEDNYDKFNKCYNDFLINIKESKAEEQKYQFSYDLKNEAFITGAHGQCIVQSGNYKKLGYNLNGKLRVLATVIGNYLGHEVRVKGGAYNIGCFPNSTDIELYSGEDPRLKETLDVFKSIPSYLKDFSVDSDGMNSYILRTLNNIDMSKYDNREKGNFADDMYISGVSQEDVQKFRDEIFETTVEDIRNYAPMMEEIINQNNICVSGSKDLIEANKDLFQSITSIS